MSLKNMAGARRALEPFADAIAKTANIERPGFRYLVQGRMGTNDIEGAWDLYSAANNLDVNTQEGLIPWLLYTETVPPNAALAAIDKARELSRDAKTDAAILGALVAVTLRTDSPQAFAEAGRALDERISFETDPLNRIMFETRRVGILTNTDPVGCCLGYWDLWTKLKNTLGSDSGTVDEKITRDEKIAFAALVLLNNYVATVANAVLEGHLTGDQANDLLGNAVDVVPTLTFISNGSPEVMDTLALLDLAREDYGSGEARAREAVALRPRNGSYRFTLARCLAGLGMLEEARAEARLSRLLLLQKEGPTGSQVQDVVAFLASI